MKRKLFIIIFESDTKAGKAFDIVLIAIILLSIILALVESVNSIYSKYSLLIDTFEWVITVFFTLEYLVRIYCHPKPLKYSFSFFGIVDLLAVAPTYLGLFFPTAQYMSVIRVVRALRIFRILKLMNYIGEGTVLVQALMASKAKITVFLFWLCSLVVILGSIMYIIEGPEHGFTSIPKGIYWAIVTLTTVGYGDIAPETPLGQFLASVVMIMGYAIIAVPTGIVSSELARIPREKSKIEPGTLCTNCGLEGHYYDAKYCRRCGAELIN